MSKPRLLDLFCGAGGVAKGYDLAGFDVVGCDIQAQKHYPYPFVQADALCLLQCLLEGGFFTASDGRHYSLADFAAIHASPPCQGDTVLRHLHKHKTYPKLTAPTRELLKATGLPYIIEGVVGAPFVDPILLCGTMFGLQTACGAELRRHRLFELSWGLVLTPTCQHYADRTIGVYGTGQPMAGKRTVTGNGHSPMDGKRVISVMGGHARDRGSELRQRKTITVTGATPQQNVVRNTIRETFPVAVARQAMGIDWMTMKELSQAIPPAYTQFIGRQLIEAIG